MTLPGASPVLPSRSADSPPVESPQTPSTGVITTPIFGPEPLPSPVAHLPRHPSLPRRSIVQPGESYEVFLTRRLRQTPAEREREERARLAVAGWDPEREARYAETYRRLTGKPLPA